MKREIHFSIYTALLKKSSVFSNMRYMMSLEHCQCHGLVAGKGLEALCVVSLKYLKFQSKIINIAAKKCLSK